MDPYTEAHLFVAAIRLVAYQKKSAAAIEDVCVLLGISSEAGHALCRKLRKLGIIDVVEDAFTLRLSVANHLEIERLPREAARQDALARELEQFKAKRQDMDKKVESIRSELEKKRQSMFSDIEARLKKELGENRKKP